MTIMLPEDVIEYILSYGDPNINEKYRFVMKQIKFLKTEFNYNRLKPYNTWYLYKDEDFKHYILYKNNSKNALNYCHITCNHTFCNMKN